MAPLRPIVAAALRDLVGLSRFRILARQKRLRRMYYLLRAEEAKGRVARRMVRQVAAASRRIRGVPGPERERQVELALDVILA